MDLKKQQVKDEINWTIEEIKDHLDWLRGDARRFKGLSSDTRRVERVPTKAAPSKAAVRTLSFRGIINILPSASYTINV